MKYKKKNKYQHQPLGKNSKRASKKKKKNKKFAMSSGRKLCKKCGVSTGGDQTNCRKCGAELDGEEMVDGEKCFSCNAMNLKNYRFCAHCAKKRPQEAKTERKKVETKKVEEPVSKKKEEEEEEEEEKRVENERKAKVAAAKKLKEEEEARRRKKEEEEEEEERKRIEAEKKAKAAKKAKEEEERRRREQEEEEEEEEERKRIEAEKKAKAAKKEEMRRREQEEEEKKAKAAAAAAAKKKAEEEARRVEQEEEEERKRIAEAEKKAKAAKKAKEEEEEEEKKRMEKLAKKKEAEKKAREILLRIKAEKESRDGLKKSSEKTPLSDPEMSSWIDEAGAKSPPLMQSEIMSWKDDEGVNFDMVEEKKVVCPSCGTENAEDAEDCTDCWEPLKPKKKKDEPAVAVKPAVKLVLKKASKIEVDDEIVAEEIPALEDEVIQPSPRSVLEAKGGGASGNPPPIPPRDYNRGKSVNSKANVKPMTVMSFDDLMNRQQAKILRYVDTLIHHASSGLDADKLRAEMVDVQSQLTAEHKAVLSRAFGESFENIVSAFVGPEGKSKLNALLQVTAASGVEETGPALVSFWISLRLPLVELAYCAMDQHLDASQSGAKGFFGTRPGPLSLSCVVLSSIFNVACRNFLKTNVHAVLEVGTASGLGLFDMCDEVLSNVCSCNQFPQLLLTLCWKCIQMSSSAAHLRGKERVVLGGLGLALLVGHAQLSGVDEIVRLGWRQTIANVVSEGFNAAKPKVPEPPKLPLKKPEKKSEPATFNKTPSSSSLVVSSSPPPPLPVSKPSPSSSSSNIVMVKGAWSKGKAPPMIQPVIDEVKATSPRKSADDDIDPTIRYDLMLDDELPPLPSQAPNPHLDKRAYKLYMLLRYEHQKRGLLQGEEVAVSSPRLPSSPTTQRKVLPPLPSPPSSPKQNRKEGPSSPVVSPRQPRQPPPAVPGRPVVVSSARADFDPTTSSPTFDYIVGDVLLCNWDGNLHQVKVVEVNKRNDSFLVEFSMYAGRTQRCKRIDLKHRPEDSCPGCKGFCPRWRVKACPSCAEQIASPRFTQMFDDLAKSFATIDDL